MSSYKTILPDPVLFQAFTPRIFNIRAVGQLNGDLNTLDAEYNKLSDHVAKGERDQHSQESLNSMGVAMVHATLIAPSNHSSTLLNVNIKSPIMFVIPRLSAEAESIMKASTFVCLA
jgi:ribosomal protein S15P/S13E